MPIEAEWNCTIYRATLCAAVCSVRIHCNAMQYKSKNVHRCRFNFYIPFFIRMKWAMLNQWYSFNVLRSKNTTEYTFRYLLWLFWHVYMVNTEKRSNRGWIREKKYAFIRKMCNCGTFHKALSRISICLTCEYRNSMHFAQRSLWYSGKRIAFSHELRLNK